MAKTPNVTSFTGTSTGTKYSVGEKYSTSNGVVQAQADGTFKNLETGKVSKGSSEQVGEALYFASLGGSDSGSHQSEYGYSGGKQTVKVGIDFGPSGSGMSGTPDAAAHAHKGSAAGLVASEAGFFTGAGEEIETQALFWNGQKLNTRPDISDGGDFEQRWGEWGGAIAGLGVMGSDLTNMATAQGKQWWNGISKMHNDANPHIAAGTRPPQYKTDVDWLQVELNKFAAQQALTQAHDPAVDGLSSIIGNPFDHSQKGALGNWFAWE